LLGQQFSDGGFSGTHETGEDNVRLGHFAKIVERVDGSFGKAVYVLIQADALYQNVDCCHGVCRGDCLVTLGNPVGGHGRQEK
jgi:hypothetical protein